MAPKMSQDDTASAIGHPHVELVYCDRLSENTANGPL